MKVDRTNYDSIKNWSNPELASLLYFIYGPIDMDRAISKQKVRLDESRRLLNETFIVPNIADVSNSSFKDRYNTLKEFKFDVDFYLGIINKLLDAISVSRSVIINEPYKSGVLLDDGHLNFCIEFSSFAIRSLKEALELYKINKN